MLVAVAGNEYCIFCQVQGGRRELILWKIYCGELRNFKKKLPRKTVVPTYVVCFSPQLSVVIVRHT